MCEDGQTRRIAPGISSGALSKNTPEIPEEPQAT
jgi:hypothetical protein